MQAPNIYSPAVAGFFSKDHRIPYRLKTMFSRRAASLELATRPSRHSSHFTPSNRVNSHTIQSMPESYSAVTIPLGSEVWGVIDSMLSPFNRDHHGLNIPRLNELDKRDIVNALYQMEFVKYNSGNKHHFEAILRRRGYEKLILKPVAVASVVAKTAPSADEKYPIMSARFKQYSVDAFNFLRSRDVGISDYAEVLKVALPTLHSVDMSGVDTANALVKKFPEQVIRGYVLRVRDDIVPTKPQLLESFANHLRERFELLNFLMRDYAIPVDKKTPITLTRDQISELGKALLRLGNKNFDITSLDSFDKFKTLYERRLKTAYDLAAKQN